jgi:hypothetical protein
MVTDVLVLIGLILLCWLGYISASSLNEEHIKEKGEDSLLWSSIAGLNILCILINSVKLLYLLL